MSNLPGITSKLSVNPFAISAKTKNALFAFTGLSFLMIGKAELDKQRAKQTISLKKERLAMVSESCSTNSLFFHHEF
jgi:hypothetical protein